MPCLPRRRRSIAARQNPSRRSRWHCPRCVHVTFFVTRPRIFLTFSTSSTISALHDDPLLDLLQQVPCHHDHHGSPVATPPPSNVATSSVKTALRRRHHTSGMSGPHLDPFALSTFSSHSRSEKEAQDHHGEEVAESEVDEREWKDSGSRSVSHAIEPDLKTTELTRDDRRK